MPSQYHATIPSLDVPFHTSKHRQFRMSDHYQILPPLTAHPRSHTTPPHKDCHTQTTLHSRLHTRQAHQRSRAQTNSQPPSTCKNDTESSVHWKMDPHLRKRCQDAHYSGSDPDGISRSQHEETAAGPDGRVTKGGDRVCGSPTSSPELRTTFQDWVRQLPFANKQPPESHSSELRMWHSLLDPNRIHVPFKQSLVLWTGQTTAKTTVMYCRSGLA